MKIIVSDNNIFQFATKTRRSSRPHYHYGHKPSSLYPETLSAWNTVLPANVSSPPVVHKSNGININSRVQTGENKIHGSNSYSTEELNQEMANLEGLMKYLNAITANEFGC